MPLNEAVQELATEPPQEVVTEAANVQQVTQSYEYTRQDGTVEHAASREEAIKLCPVLGNLAMKDPNAADLLLNMASVGQAKMAEKTERLKPETPKQEPTSKSEKVARPTEPTKVQPAETVTATDAAHLNRQSQEAVSTGIIQEQKPVGAVVPSKAAAVLEKVATQEKPKRHSLLEQPNPLHRSMAEAHMLHEQQIREAAQAALLDKRVQPLPVRAVAPEPTELARQTRVHEVLEAGQTLVALEQQPIIAQEQIEYPVSAAADTYLQDKLAVFNIEQLVVDQERADLVDEQVEFVPPVIDTLLDYGQIEPVDKINELAGDVPAVDEVISEVEQIEPVSWSDELDKEPLELCEDFTKALQALVTISAEQLSVTTELTIDATEPSIDDKPENQPMPAIAVAVAERLDELETDEKEVVSPVPTDIVKTIHLMDMLEAKEAASVVVGTMQAELEELVITFFEQLGIEYEPEDIEHFITVLLRSDFQPPQPEVTELVPVDLEHDGTHEAKIHFTSTTASLIADVEHNLEQLLGTLVLFNTPVREAA